MHWNHESTAAGIIGAIDPDSMRETSEGLYIEGRLDLEGSATAREAWRSMKAGVLGLSFGYMVVESRKAADGANDLLELDLFEISLTPSPVNAEARFLDMKSSAAYPPTEDELRRRSRALGVDVPTTEELQRRRAAKVRAARDLRHRCWEVMLENAYGGPLPPPKPPPDPRAIARQQRERTEELRRECRRLGVKC